MTNDNPYTYALTADPGKPLREAKQEIDRLRDELQNAYELTKTLTAERDEAKMKLAEAKTRMVRLLSQLQELEEREQ